MLNTIFSNIFTSEQNNKHYFVNWEKRKNSIISFVTKSKDRNYPMLKITSVFVPLNLSSTFIIPLY